MVNQTLCLKLEVFSPPLCVDFRDLLLFLMFVFFSGDKFYYKLDINNVPESVSVAIKSKTVTFITHGYTDAAKFNNSG